ncbi:MAG: hypothetical protein KDE24_27485, partial [Caldilinea sp.]|nr:hypothetical protein [Caldilinea sp.]
FHFDEDRELFLAGVTAAGQLTGASAVLQNAQSQLAGNLATTRSRVTHLQSLADEPGFAELSPLQLARWRALVEWFSVQ